MHDTCSDIIFQPHDYDDDDDDRPSDVMHNIDANNHFYDNIPTNSRCCRDQQFV